MSCKETSKAYRRFYIFEGYDPCRMDVAPEGLDAEGFTMWAQEQTFALAEKFADLQEKAMEAAGSIGDSELSDEQVAVLLSDSSIETFLQNVEQLKQAGTGAATLLEEVYGPSLEDVAEGLNQYAAKLESFTKRYNAAFGAVKTKDVIEFSLVTALLLFGAGLLWVRGAE